ncbi:MAG: hypothetical protein ABH877_00115 [bacterium]
MALRYSCKACAVAVAGTTFTHGLLATPDEWSVSLRGPAPGAAALYVNGAPTSTSLVVAASGAAGTGDVFASVNHSIAK